MDKSWDVSVIELTFGPTSSGEVYYGPNNQRTPALSYTGGQVESGLYYSFFDKLVDERELILSISNVIHITE